MIQLNQVEAPALPYNAMSIILRKDMNVKPLKYLLTSLLTIAGLLYFSNVALSQTAIKSIGLDEAIQVATTNNKNVTIAQMDEKIAFSNYKQTEAIYLPQVSLSYTALVTNNPLNAFGIKLQQRRISENDFSPALLNNPSATADFMMRVDVQQPLINMDKIYQRKSALKQTELYQFKTQRTKEYIIYQVQQAYLQLQLAYEGKKVLEASLKTINGIHKFTSDRYAQGLLQKTDALNVEVQIKTTETQIAEANSNIANASDYLSLLMNVPEGTVYATTEFPLVASASKFADSLATGRADFKAMEIAIQSYNLAIESSKKSYLPKLNAFANYQLNDSRALGFGANAYMAGLQLSWDIFKGNQTKNKISTQTLERNKMTEELVKQKEESNLELQKIKRQLADAQFKISQQQLAVNMADEALRILQNRYAQGLVNTTEVLTAQTQLAQQKLFYQQAVYTANSTVAYIQYLTSK